MRSSRSSRGSCSRRASGQWDGAEEEDASQNQRTAKTTETNEVIAQKSPASTGEDHIPVIIPCKIGAAAPGSSRQSQSFSSGDDEDDDDEVPTIVPMKLGAKQEAGAALRAKGLVAISKEATPEFVRRVSGHFDLAGASDSEEELDMYSGESVSSNDDDSLDILETSPPIAILRDLQTSQNGTGSFIVAASSSEDGMDDDEIDMLLGGLTHVPKSPRKSPSTTTLPIAADGDDDDDDDGDDDDDDDIDDGSQLISIPKSSKRTLALRQGPMSQLLFSSCEKKEQYDLPSRVQWQLWCEILECKLTKDLRENSSVQWQLYVKVEVGRDAHFEVLTSKVDDTGAAVISFDSESPPRERFTLFHRSRAKCRLSVWNKIPGGLDQLIADCSYPLKKLEADVARVGWVKLKADPSQVANSKSPRREGSMKGGFMKKSPRSALAPKSSSKKVKPERELRATVKIGFLRSRSMTASWLFLIDFEAEEVLYYTRVETLADLNPVFHSTERKPFKICGKMDSKQIALHVGDSPRWTYQVSMLPVGSKAFIVGADGVGKDNSAFHCNVELIPPTKPQILCKFTLSGSLEGMVEQISAVPFHRYYIMLKVDVAEDHDVSDFIHNEDPAFAQRRKKVAKREKRYPDTALLAEVQWRNKRDMKMEIHAGSDVDIAVIISVALALRMLQKQNKQK